MIELSEAKEALGVESDATAGRQLEEARNALDALVRSGAVRLDAQHREWESIGRAQGFLLARHHLTPPAAVDMLLALAQEDGVSVFDAAIRVLDDASRASTAVTPVPLPDWWRPVA
jgi:hypothetical protein